MLRSLRSLTPPVRPVRLAVRPLGLVRPLAARSLCTAAAEAQTAAQKAQAQITRWGSRLAHDNTFLSYHRNAMISTVAGGALLQYSNGEGRPPLAGVGLLCMGGLYMYIGSSIYIAQMAKFAGPLRLGNVSVLLTCFNAAWPTVLWSVSLACMLDETPQWLLEGLRRVESHLPDVIHTSLFLDPAALYPVCRLLQGLVVLEDARLQTVRRHAAGYWSLTQPSRAPLTDLDVATIIERRLERLEHYRLRLETLARSERAVPTAIAAPLLDKLRTECEQLQKVLEDDISPQHGARASFFWRVATILSSEHRTLR